MKDPSGVVGGGMVLFAAGPVLPADGCAEIELADILFLRNREQCHFRVESQPVFRKISEIPFTI
ncbi:hypothetical protein, partial [Ruminococcus sp.]|uniref:hypothetical protein n=1 Tax=Ruminococcus sp. TaxID=41978 RepID=UPI003AB326F2